MSLVSLQVSWAGVSVSWHFVKSHFFQVKYLFNVCFISGCGAGVPSVYTNIAYYLVNIMYKFCSDMLFSSSNFLSSCLHPALDSEHDHNAQLMAFITRFLKWSVFHTAEGFENELMNKVRHLKFEVYHGIESSNSDESPLLSSEMKSSNYILLSYLSGGLRLDNFFSLSTVKLSKINNFIRTIRTQKSLTARVDKHSRSRTNSNQL